MTGNFSMRFSAKLFSEVASNKQPWISISFSIFFSEKETPLKSEPEKSIFISLQFSKRTPRNLQFLNVFLSTRDYDYKLLLAILIIYQIPSVILFASTTYNYMSNILYWFTVGLVVSVNRISIRNKSYNISKINHYNNIVPNN